MRKLLVSALTCLALSLTSLGQEINTGIQIKDRISVEYSNGHSCMTQTRADTKEEALYSVDKCGPVKYELTKKGKVLTVHQKNDKDKWYEWGAYKILHSFSDTFDGNERITFLCTDGSSITYVPKAETGPLVILDLVGEDFVYFIYN